MVCLLAVYWLSIGSSVKRSLHAQPAHAPHALLTPIARYSSGAPGCRAILVPPCTCTRARLLPACPRHAHAMLSTACNAWRTLRAETHPLRCPFQTMRAELAGREVGVPPGPCPVIDIADGAEKRRSDRGVYALCLLTHEDVYLCVHEGLGIAAERW